MKVIAGVKERLVAIGLLLGLLALMWAVFGVNALLFDGALNRYGLAPLALPYRFREVVGALTDFNLSLSYVFGVVRGILLSPLLHADFGHLWANSVPLLILGGLLALWGAPRFVGSTLVVVVVGGLLVWLFGRPAYHIGASGLVFGYFGCLVALGWYRKSILSIGVAALVTLVYGVSMVAGALPQGGFISWEGHLFGMIAGALAARMGRDSASWGGGRDDGIG